MNFGLKVSVALLALISLSGVAQLPSNTKDMVSVKSLSTGCYELNNDGAFTGPYQSAYYFECKRYSKTSFRSWVYVSESTDQIFYFDNGSLASVTLKDTP